MTKTFIGVDSTGTPCVKITRDALDPATTPDSQVSAFYYSSKWTKDVKLGGIDITNYSASDIYYPPGSGESNFKKKTVGGTTGGAIIRPGFFGDDFPYTLALYDIKIKAVATGRYIEQHRSLTQGNEDPAGREPGYRTLVGWYNQWWWESHPELGNALQFFGSTYGQQNAPDITKVLVVWRLPGDETPIADSAVKPPIAGQRVAEITKDWCRVAKPGYDTRNATPTQLAFDSSGRPLSIIKAGDIAAPAGLTVVELGRAVDESTVCDMIVYENEVISFPVGGYYTDLAVSYWFSGTKLFIQNDLTPCRCRFMVLTQDALGPSSGVNKVFRQFTEAGQNVVQFLRPGSADPPRLSDIILDSRWPAIQILAEGYQSIAAQADRVPPGNVNQGQSFSVNFNGDGFFPFVKYCTVHQSIYGDGRLVKPPSMRLIENYNNSTRYNSGGTTFCKLSGDQATFWTYEGNPIFERHNTSSGWQFDYNPTPIIGIRYYILGIPQT